MDLPASPAPKPVPVPAAGLTGPEQAMFGEMNRERVGVGCKLVVADPKLTAAGSTDSVMSAVQPWSSPGHRANISDCSHTRAGTADVDRVVDGTARQGSAAALA